MVSTSSQTARDIGAVSYNIEMKREAIFEWCGEVLLYTFVWAVGSGVLIVFIVPLLRYLYDHFLFNNGLAIYLVFVGLAIVTKLIKDHFRRK